MKFSIYSNSVSFARRRTTGPRGITVLEVLISIGVVAVGLLGVAALIPAAGHHARKGLEADYRSQVGQAAFRDFRIRGLGDAVTETQNNLTRYYSKALLTSDGSMVQFTPNTGYCIDPISVAANQTGSLGPLTRLTVRNKIAENRQEIASGGTPMGPEQAESAFTAWDDLVCQNPEKNDDKAIVKAGQEECAGRRQALGDYSWMATLVPEPGSGDLYTLSAVVLHRRVCTLTPKALAKDPLQATFTVKMLSGGLGGGDVQITGLGEAVGSRMKPGTWILLTNESNYHRWYQIIAAEATDEKQAIPQYFTLRGPDWLGGNTVTGVYVKGAVGVYEKTIRLVSPSQWDVTPPEGI